MTDSTYFVKSTPLSAFTGSFQHCRCLTDTLKICMKKFDEFTGLLTEPFSDNCT